jgi:hypothetical protein
MSFANKSQRTLNVSAIANTQRDSAFVTRVYKKAPPRSVLCKAGWIIDLAKVKWEQKRQTVSARQDLKEEIGVVVADGSWLREFKHVAV